MGGLYSTPESGMDWRVVALPIDRIRGNLLRLLGERGLSQKELAEKAKLDESSISNILGTSWGADRVSA
jgi:lambda repressor-like predicted transcriptional regulator